MTVPDLLNLRDVGGLRTPEGRRVRHGVLWRGATPAFLDDAGARRLRDEVGIRTRVDLRSENERTEETSAALLATERRVLEREATAGGVRWIDEDLTRHEIVAGHYLAYLKHSPDTFADLARVLLDPDERPVLVHCTAGKDRTGTAVALLLGAVGVDDAEIIADYALTAEAMPALLEQFRRLPAYEQRLADLPAEAFASPPEAMAHFLRLLREEYDGPRGYLTAAGLTEPELDALVDVLLEPDSSAI